MCSFIYIYYVREIHSFMIYNCLFYKYKKMERENRKKTVTTHHISSTNNTQIDIITLCSLSIDRDICQTMLFTLPFILIPSVTAMTAHL